MYASRDRCLHSGRAGKSDEHEQQHEKGNHYKLFRIQKEWNLSENLKPLTESGERQKLMTGLLNWSKFSSSYVSNDHKQMVASVLPDTSTSLVELIATHTTGPRWWSIFITFLWVIDKVSWPPGMEMKKWKKNCDSKTFLSYLLFTSSFGLWETVPSLARSEERFVCKNKLKTFRLMSFWDENISEDLMKINGFFTVVSISSRLHQDLSWENLLNR